MKYYTMQHCGGLKEALETRCDCDSKIAEKLIESGLYEFYGFDDRINCDRYILNNFHLAVGLPTWLLKEK